ncbi:GATA transcription factor 27 [Lathyrus oleraceus]|uniref:GATA-type domain-containing protein n=1 Tax=Pisum sativum TaxID=3888 RepID=A0A9D5BL44_PEA|nr:GATA transcription factor 27-like [Pisum sativum]KAI5445702.1 hypothetical protein KIW84_013797 [Pisum sativum]
MMNGPCMHCGIDSTPLWRKGPNGKSILCNACGSRFKAKGNLENYLPKIALQNRILRLNIEKANDKGLKLSNKTSGGINTNTRDFKIPRKKRSPVKKLTPIERFHKTLLRLSKSEKLSNDNILLTENMNNFMPNNEIGLGCILLHKTNVTPTN